MFQEKKRLLRDFLPERRKNESSRELFLSAFNKRRCAKCGNHYQVARSSLKANLAKSIHRFGAEARNAKPRNRDCFTQRSQVRASFQSEIVGFMRSLRSRFRLSQSKDRQFQEHNRFPSVRRRSEAESLNRSMSEANW